MSESSESQILPIFPLTGSLLLPGTYLPLNIFEERYRNMVRDVLEGDGRIGMVQPLVPGLDNFGIPPLDLDDPELYTVGCCGTIDKHEPQEDGRYLIVLKGTARFRILGEIEKTNGYRRVRADFGDFEIDTTSDDAEVDAVEVLAVLDKFARERELEFDRDVLTALSGPRLVNSLSTALPFSAAEKQALLEAHSPEDRASLLITLMGIESGSGSAAETFSPPTIH